MLYGFGDDLQPLPETLDLMEDIVLDYSTTLLHKVGGAVMDGGGALRRLAGCSRRDGLWTLIAGLQWTGGG